ncbi:hypothetical protein DDE05_09040 [Streptomyces cavourensis]|nr:hypothetical protein DDE05_09040 [Streptomyces cavourensis]
MLFADRANADFVMIEKHALVTHRQGAVALGLHRCYDLRRDDFLIVRHEIPSIFQYQNVVIDRDVQGILNQVSHLLLIMIDHRSLQASEQYLVRLMTFGT